MSTEETKNMEKDLFDALQFALNAFFIAMNTTPSSNTDGNTNNNSAKIKNVRVETVESSHTEDGGDKWILVVSYQDKADAANTQNQEDFLSQMSRNRRYFKKMIVNKDPLKIESINDVD